MLGPKLQFQVRDRQDQSQVISVELGIARDEKEVLEKSLVWMNSRPRLYMMSPYPWSQAAEREWLDGLGKKDDRIHWFIYANDVLIGGLGLTHVDLRNQSAEVGCMIGDMGYWGRGIAPAATAVVLDWGFQNVVAGGLHHVEVGAIVANNRSCNTLKKVGFTEVGIVKECDWINGQWHDHWWGTMLQRDWLTMRETKLQELNVVSHNLYPDADIV